MHKLYLQNQLLIDYMHNNPEGQFKETTHSRRQIETSTRSGVGSFAVTQFEWATPKFQTKGNPLFKKIRRLRQRHFTSLKMQAYISYTHSCVRSVGSIYRHSSENPTNRYATMKLRMPEVVPTNAASLNQILSWHKWPKATQKMQNQIHKLPGHHMTSLHEINNQNLEDNAGQQRLAIFFNNLKRKKHCHQI